MRSQTAALPRFPSSMRPISQFGIATGDVFGSLCPIPRRCWRSSVLLDVIQNAYRDSLLRHLFVMSHIYCGVTNALLFWLKRNRKLSLQQTRLSSVKMPSKKGSLSAILSKAKRRKLSLRQEKDNEATRRLDSQRQRSARRRIAKATTKTSSPVNERANDEHRCLSQHALSMCVNNHVLLEYS